jgi:lipoprotein-anchoring transpeptidase ErfK/SrfK
MEVLMSRNGNKLSRGLVAGVGVTIALGGVAIFHHTSKTKANDPSKEVALAGGAPAPTGGTTAAPAAKPAAAPAPKVTGQISLPGGAKPVVTLQPGAAGTQVAVNDPKTGGVPPTTVPPATGTPATPAAPAYKPPVVSNLPAVSVGTALADGKAQIDAGNLLAGRTILNEALSSNQFSDGDAQRAKELMALANETLIFSPRRFTDDPVTGSHTVANGERPMKIASTYAVTWELLGRVNGIQDARRIRVGQTLKTVKGPFHAVVSKSRFTMDIYAGSPGERGSIYIRTFPVGLGKTGSTPTGTWMLAPQGKLKNPKWWGTADEPAREAGDPLNPIGKFWMGLNGTDGDAVGKEGFGIHGTIDPDSIGKEMSHGCIRLVNENVERVYEMLIDGKSTVIVRD